MADHQRIFSNFNPELEKLLERAKAVVEQMSPQERSSMYALQALGWTCSEMVMSVYEDNVPKTVVRKTLQSLLDGFNGDATVYMKLPAIIMERIWVLLPADKERFRQRLIEMLDQLDRQDPLRRTTKSTASFLYMTVWDDVGTFLSPELVHRPF